MANLARLTVEEERAAQILCEETNRIKPITNEERGFLRVLQAGTADKVQRLFSRAA